MQVQMPSREEARVPSKSRIMVLMGKKIPEGYQNVQYSVAQTLDRLMTQIGSYDCE